MAEPVVASNRKDVPTQRVSRLPELQLIYDTAPVGLAFLSPDCRYLHINQRMTAICGISAADHIGRTVRETVPKIADQVETIVQTVLSTGEPLTGIEVNGQRTDGLNAEHFWLTNWYPVKGQDGCIAGISVVSEEITERKRAAAELASAEDALRESEARFRELAENMSQSAWTADPMGRIYWYNQRWYDYSGTTFEEMQGSGWQKLHHPDHLDRVDQHMRRCFASGTPWEDSFPLRGRDGSYRWFLSRALPIRNAAGEVIRWFGTNTDVTEQIEAETALRELNANLEQRVDEKTQERNQIWNVCQDLLVICDLEGKFLDVNPAWSTLGWTRSELLGKTSQWLLHPDEQEKARAETEGLASGRRTRRFELRFREKSGSYRVLSWEAVPHQGRIYAMARDITEQRRAEIALQDSRRELAQVNRQITLAAMTASIAHEINQPLTAIVASGNAGMRWLGRAEPNVERAQSAFAHIVDAGHRASDIVANIRAMFRKDDHERHAININDLVSEVLALVQGEIQRQQAVLQIELAEEAPPITVERVPLQQVLLNLIMNGLDAMSSIEDRDRLLSIKSEWHEPGGVRISVTDSGTGIDPKNRDRIFEPFFTTKAQGMGMGLSICRSIVEAHGGRLWASNGRPHGSVFHFQLPGDATGRH